MKNISLCIVLCFMMLSCTSGDDEKGTRSNPITVTIGEPYSGNVGANGSVFFKFSCPGGNYRIEVKNVETDLGIELYDNAAFDVLLDSSDQYLGNFDEEIFYNCSAKTYYVKVNELAGNDGGFTLAIDPAAI